MFLTCRPRDVKFLPIVTTDIPTSYCELHCKQLWVTASSTYFQIGKRLLVTKGNLSLVLSLAAQDVAEQCPIFGRTLFHLVWTEQHAGAISFLPTFLLCVFWHKQCMYDPLDNMYLAGHVPKSWNWDSRGTWWQGAVAAAKITELQCHRKSLRTRQPKKKSTKWAGPYHRNMTPDSAPFLGFDLFLLITSPVSLGCNPNCFWTHYHEQFQCLIGSLA